MITTHKKILRNGDWSITPYTGNFEGKELKHTGTFVFAEGEATGHFHAIVVERPEDLTIEKTATGDYVFVLKSQARITHPEHSLKTDLFVAPGTYRLNQRREKDWFQMSVRKVLD